MMRIQRCCLILLCTVQYVLGSTMFSISDSGVQCNGGNFQVDSLSVDCGETYCTFGSAVEISGTATITNTLSTGYPTATVKAMNVVTIYDKVIDLCGSLSSDSSSCPSAGSYSIQSFQFKIPGDGEAQYNEYAYWGKGFSLKVVFDFGDTASTCWTTVTLTQANGYQMVAGAFVMFGMAGVLTKIARRRRTATLQLEEKEGTASHFEMMPNEGAARV